MHGESYGSLDGHISLTYRIATLYVIYHVNMEEILWFGQLVAFFPGILDQLKEEVVCDKSEMVSKYPRTPQIQVPIRNTLLDEYSAKAVSVTAKTSSALYIGKSGQRTPLTSIMIAIIQGGIVFIKEDLPPGKVSANN